MTDMDVNKCVVYGRVVSGVLYTSGFYHRREVTNASVVRLRTAEIGTMQKLVAVKVGVHVVQMLFVDITSLSQFIPLPFDQTAESTIYSADRELNISNCRTSHIV